MSELRIEHKGHLLEVTLNRPDKNNALTPEMLLGLKTCLESYAQHPQTLVLLLKGAGEGFFSAGYDINRIPTGDDQGTKDFAKEKPLDLAVQAIEAYPFPTLAMLQGSVYGGACELAFACDFRLAREGIKMCLPPAKLGLVYSVEGLARIAQVVGLSALKKMIYTAQAFPAEELLSMGAVDQVLPPEALDQAAHDLALRIGEMAPLSLKGHKRIFQLLQNQPLPPADLAEARAWIEKSFLSQDAREGRQAFLEKRPPHFTGT